MKKYLLPPRLHCPSGYLKPTLFAYSPNLKAELNIKCNIALVFIHFQLAVIFLVNIVFFVY